MAYRDQEHRGYKISDNGLQTRKISTIGKGSLPKELRGMYSTSYAAELAIDAYLAEKGNKNAKTVSDSRG